MKFLCIFHFISILPIIYTLHLRNTAKSKQITLTLLQYLYSNFSEQENEKDTRPISISQSQHIRAVSDTAALLS